MQIAHFNSDDRMGIDRVLWLCDVRGLIAADRYGDVSYGGSYQLIYFEDFRALRVRTNGKWVLINKPVPKHIRSCYAAAKYFGV